MNRISLLVVLIPVFTGLTLTQPTTPDGTLFYNVNTSLSRRDTVIDISNYGCGASVFCNTSLAKYENRHCYTCIGCYCDDICSFYGDCCPDRLFDKTTDLPIPPSPYISCQRQHLKSNSAGSYIFMVTSCPKEATADQLTRSKCEQPSHSTLKESTPVSVESSKIAYRNVYCAMCHQQNEYIEWRHEVKCTRTDFVSSVKGKDELWYLVMNDNGCSIKSFPPQNIDSRTCYIGLNDRCDTAGRWETPNEQIEQLCLQYYSPVETLFKKYRNIFCSVCNGNKLSRGKICSEGSIGKPSLRTAPLSVLIDFNPKPRLISSPSVVDITAPKCNDTELYDPISESCRKAECSSGRILSDGDCELILGSLAGVGYSGSLALKFSEDISFFQWIELLKDYTGNLRKSLAKFSPFMFTQMKQTLYNTVPHFREGDQSTSVKVTGALIDFDFVSTSAESVLSFENTLRDLHSDSNNFTVDGKTGTLMSIPVRCLVGVNNVLEGLPGNVFHMNDRQFHDCEFNICDFSAVIYRPILNILDCPHLEFRLSEYNLTFSMENSSMEISNQTINLTESEYWICDDVIKICSSELLRIEQLISKPLPNQTVSVMSVSPAMTIVSLVCIILSLVCLLLTFVVYCLLSQLRTLPGKNTMVLVIYLFLAQLFFQIGIRLTYNSNLCRAMGIIIHYLWIATFMSMATCAFHMYTVFTRMSAKPFHNTLEETKTLIRYIVISNVIAVIVIGVSIGYNAGVSRGTEIGYGGDICFLSSPTDIGIFFAAPLGVVLVFNTFCFIRVAVSIRQVPNMKSSKNQTNRNHAAVYFRLSILLGFTWIFGFVAAALQQDVLWYIFLILNGLQGVFLFIAYCLNRRILEMLKARYCGAQSDKYRSSGQVNTPMASTETSSL